MPDQALEVAVVHHRTPELLARALERLATAAPTTLVRVVDTAFDPTLASQLDGAHPRLEWLSVPNHSYSAAVNAAARAARQPLLLQMNADVLVTEDTLPELRRALEEPSVAAAGPLPMTADGRLQDMGLPYRWHYARARWRGRGRGGGVEVPWLAGCVQLLRLDALHAVGGFDPRLRFYNEDLEWCVRARRAGWRCRLVATEVVHLGGASGTARLTFRLEGLRGGYAFTRRHGPAWLRPLHRWGLAAGAWATAQLSGEPRLRSAWRDLALRSARDELERSCFGPQLETD